MEDWLIAWNATFRPLRLCGDLVLKYRHNALSRLSKKSFVGFHVARDETSRDFVARGRRFGGEIGRLAAQKGEVDL